MRRRKGTGTIEARNGLLVARLPDKERTVLGRFTDRAMAERTLDAAVYDLKHGNVTTSETLGTYGRKVLDRREREGKRGIQAERGRWRLYVDGQWPCAAWPVANLRRRDVLAWLRALRAQGLAVQTRANALNLLRAVLRHAVDDELAEANVALDVRVPREGRSDETSTYLSLEELGALFWSASLEGKTLIAVAVWTGMRQGELRSLRAADVFLDGDAPYLVVRYGAPGKATKSGKIRRVPLFGAGLEALRAWRIPANDRGLVFPTLTGCARPRGHIVEHEDWRAWLAAAGIARRVRWHDLRHTAGTLLLDGALTGRPWSKEAVQALLGHSSVAVTERYARTTDGMLEAAARATSHAYATQATEPPRGTAARAAEIVQENRSRLRDLNSRPTVYEGGAKSKGRAALPDLRGLAEAFAVAVAEADPFAIARGLDLAAAVLLEGMIRRTA